MSSLNMTYNPDHQQVLEHHKKLLEKSERARFEHQAMETPKRSLPSLRKWLGLLTSERHAKKTVMATSRTPSTQT